LRAGAYLPVSPATKILMTERQGTSHLAGPSLVKAAIGQVGRSRRTWAARKCISENQRPTVDFYEKSDESCLKTLCALWLRFCPRAQRAADSKIENKGSKSAKSPDTRFTISSVSDGQKNYDARRSACQTIVDSNSGRRIQSRLRPRTLVTAYGAASPVGPTGIVGEVNGCKCARKKEGIPDGRASSLFRPSADQSRRVFVMDCNQDGLPIIFFPGRDRGSWSVADAEQAGSFAAARNS